MTSSTVHKFEIKCLPADNLFLRCDDVFGPMLRGGARFVIQQSEFETKNDCYPAVTNLAVVTPSDNFSYRDITRWLHDNHARAGTLSELCDWVEQHPEASQQFVTTLALGTVLTDGLKERGNIHFIPFARRSDDLVYLEIRHIAATWRRGASFLAIKK